MHGGLEFAESRFVIGFHVTGSDVFCCILESGCQILFCHRANEGDVAEFAGGIGFDDAAVSIIVRFESV